MDSRFPRLGIGFNLPEISVSSKASKVIEFDSSRSGDKGEFVFEKLIFIMGRGNYILFHHFALR
jgi:hypothetical protein